MQALETLLATQSSFSSVKITLNEYLVNYSENAVRRGRKQHEWKGGENKNKNSQFLLCAKQPVSI